MKVINWIKELAGKCWHWAGRLLRGFRRLTLRDGSSISDEKPPYTNCWNCGAELVGGYCHRCGQEAIAKHPSMWSFIFEYIENVFMLEKKLLPTLTNLVFHPGRLAKEYFEGRFVAYINPLKLNIFLLITMIAFFAAFGTDSKVENSFDEFLKREDIKSDFALSAVEGNVEYRQKVIASTERDTIKLLAMHSSVEKYPHLVEVVEKITVTEDFDVTDTLIAVVPTMFLSDGLIVETEDYCYQFSLENKVVDEGIMLNELLGAWHGLISTLFGHFPLLMLFTAPFMAWALRMIVRRKEHPRVFYYIFTFYYMAYVEFLFLMLYLANVTFGLGYDTARIILQTMLFFYLTVALKRTYKIKSWIGSAVAGVIINSVYMIACLLVIAAVSFTVLVITIINSVA